MMNKKFSKVRFDQIAVYSTFLAGIETFVEYVTCMCLKGLVNAAFESSGPFYMGKWGCCVDAESTDSLIVQYCTP